MELGKFNWISPKKGFPFKNLNFSNFNSSGENLFDTNIVLFSLYRSRECEQIFVWKKFALIENYATGRWNIWIFTFIF